MTDTQAQGAGGSGDFDPNADRYPDPRRVFPRVLEDPDYPEGDVERIEMTFLANGEATYRVWAARAEDAVGGVLSDA